MMFILGSSGLHQGTKRAKLRQSQNSCKMPNFFTFDYSPLAAHGFVEPGMALARFLLLYSDLYQTCESSFQASYWLML